MFTILNAHFILQKKSSVYDSRLLLYRLQLHRFKHLEIFGDQKSNFYIQFTKWGREKKNNHRLHKDKEVSKFPSNWLT